MLVPGSEQLMLFVRSKLEARTFIFLWSFVFAGIFVHRRGRLCHTDGLPTADFFRQPLNKTPTQHRPSILDDLLEIRESLHGASR